MKHVIQRILKWSGLGLAGVIALLVLTVAVVLNTSFGGRATLRVLSRLPVDVSVADFQGRLASSFTLTGIVYRSEQLDANVDTLHVEWRPMGLMRKRLLIDRVLVAGVETIVRATGTEAETEAAPIDTTGSAVLELPVDIELGEIRVRRAGASIPGGIEVRNVELFATGRPNAYRAEIDATISGGEVPQTIVHMDAEGSLEHVVLERFHARLLDGSVTVSGRAAWAPDIEWDVAVAVDSIAPAPLLGDSVRYDGSITLRAATRGKFTDEGLRAFVRVDTLLGSLGEYTVSGRGELDARETHATITGFEFRWGDMRLAIDGDAQWSPTISWELALMADRITPSLFMPDPGLLPGSVTAYISTRGEITDVISASLEIDSLAGVLRDLNVSGRGSVTVQGDRIAVDSLVVGWGANQLRLAGVYDNQVDLRVRVVIPDLADVMPDAGGSVYIDGRLRGSRDAPAIEARVRIDSVRVGEYRGDYFAADVELDLTDGGTVAADVRAQGIEAAGQIIDSVTVVASGSTMAHEVTVGVGAQGKTLGITLLGSWDDEVWAGTLDRLDVGLGIFDNWSLAALAPIEASPVHIRIDPVRLVSSGSMITMAGYWSAGDSIRVSLDVDSLAYARADTLLPTGVSVTGWIDLALDAAVSPGGEVAANLSVVSSPGRISWQDGQTPRAIEFDSTFVTGGVDSSGAFAYLGARIHREGEVITNISGSFHMPEVHNFERMPDEPQFTARLRALFADLSFIALLSRDIGATGGRLEADAGFEGTLLDPQFMGTIALTGGMIDFIPLGLNVRDVEFTASGSRGQGLVLNGSMRSGGGTLEMTTELGREESSVHIRGQNFAVSNTAEARVRISPEIGMMLKDGQFNLEGEVRVPFARIEVFQAPQSAVGVSRDVVIVGADSTAGKALDVHADLRVVLAEDSVTFRGFGFNGEIQGSMLVSERPGRPTTASGELKIVKGTYDAYGQLLTIDPGRIRYAGGPIDNPGFDIRAFREITEHSVIAGVLVRGTARRPQVTIFSEPAMSQNEALSYMLTGQPLTSDNQRDMMAAAALSMGMAQGNAAMQGIGREVGLDDVRFETGGTLEEASFVAGKYLSPQLYISNTMGLFDRVSTWRVRYFISKKWTLQAESGKTTGSDLFYRIERGK